MTDQKQKVRELGVKKRILSMLLIVCITLAMLPESAWAAQEPETVEEAEPVTEETDAEGTRDVETEQENDLTEGTEKGEISEADTKIEADDQEGTLGREQEDSFIESVEDLEENSSVEQTQNIPNGQSVQTISGTCGENASWVVDTVEEKLIISGTGAMEDYSHYNNVPWRECLMYGSIEKIVIEHGITSIGNFAFYSGGFISDITIPETVTYIGKSAFSYCRRLNNIVLPEGITCIGSDAFSDCDSLDSIIIPEKVNCIEVAVFYGCNSLVDITIPEGVTSIERGAFSQCTSLESISLPSEIASIGANAFYGCKNLNKIVIPEGVSIGEGVFEGCTSLINAGPIGGGYNLEFEWTESIPDKAFKNSSLVHVILPEGMISIGQNAFAGSTSLQSIEIPDGVLNIGDRAFLDCSSLTTVTIPDSLTEIGDYVFSGAGLTELEIPGNIVSIGESAFGKCVDLESVVVQEGVISIGGYAFSFCTGLESVRLPSTISLIRNNAFYKCENLSKITILGNFSGDVGLGTGVIYTGIFYGCTSLISAGPIGGGYNLEFGWTESVPEGVFRYSSLVHVTLPEGITSIEPYAFLNSTSLQSIEIPDSVINIGSRAFEGCSSLTTVAIPKSLTEINYGVFSGAGLTELEIPGNVVSIKTKAFEKCADLEKVVMQEGISSIDQYAFGCCSNLIYVALPKSLTKMPWLYHADGDSGIFEDCPKLLSAGPVGGGYNIEYAWTESIPKNAFGRCNALSSVVFPEGMTSIGSEAFFRTRLKDVTIPQSMKVEAIQAFRGLSGLTSAGPVGGDYSIKFPWTTDIPAGALKNMTYLRSITIPDEVTSIGESAFNYCSALTDIVIPDGVTEIKVRTFSGCTSLQNITIPDGVTIINSSAFSGCTSLQNIAIPDGVTTINSSTFSGCTSLRNITIPAHVTTIGQSAFYGCTSLTNIIIPSNVVSIGERAFEGCFSLSSAGPIGGGYEVEYGWTESIPAYAFSYSKLANISISNTISTIGHSAFLGCTSLSDVRIPYSVTSIGGYAFKNCKSLTSFTIPGSVTSMSGSIFEGCENLTSVGPIGSGYDIEYGWKTTIPDYAFKRASLTNVKISDSITTIGEEAFDSCSGLTNIVFPDNVINVKNQAFSYCRNLTKIGIEGNISFWYLSFSKCTSIKDIYYFSGESDWKNFSSTESYKYCELPKSNVSIHFYSRLLQEPPKGKSNITLGSSNTLTVGDTDALASLFSVSCGTGITSGTVSWTSSNPSVFRLTGSTSRSFGSSGTSVGVYGDALKAGTSTITVKVTNGISRSFTVTIRDDSKAQINVSTVDPMYLGETNAYAGGFILSCKDRTATGTVSWESSNPNVVKLTEDTSYNYTGGFAWVMIYGDACAIGTSTITITSDDGASSSYKVEVLAVESAVQLASSSREMDMGTTGNVSASITFGTYIPTDAYSWTWTVDNPDIVAFDENGLDKYEERLTPSSEEKRITDTKSRRKIYARKPGEAKVTCMLSDGTQRSIKISVYSEAQRRIQELVQKWQAQYDQYVDAVDDVIEEASSADIEIKSLEEQSKKMQETLQMVTKDPNMDARQLSHVYMALMQMLVKETDRELAISKIKVSDLDKLPANIVNAVAKDIKNTSYTYTDPQDGVTVEITILNAYGAKFGSATYEEYKNGRIIRYTMPICSSEQAVKQAVNEYVFALLKMEENVAIQVYKELYKDLTKGLFGKGASGLTESFVNQLDKKYGEQFGKLTAGQVPTMLNSCYNYYSHMKKLIKGDFNDVATILSSAKGIEFKDSSIKDKTVKKAVKELQAIRDSIVKAMEQYLKDEGISSEKKLWFGEGGGVISMIMCPVDVKVLDSSGQQIGFVGDSDEMWFDETILSIRQTGEVKTIFSKDRNISLQITGTGSGVLNCTFEEIYGGEIVGRTNYYDIPLLSGTSVSAQISALEEMPGESGSLQVSMAQDGASIAPGANIQAGAYADHTVYVYCGAKLSEGGEVYGGGAYVVGDTVMVQACAEKGYLFLGWQDESHAVVSGSTVYEFTAREDIVLTAIFVKGDIEETPEEIKGIKVLPVTGPSDQVEIEAEESLFSGGAVILAASYDTDGKMTDIVSGMLSEDQKTIVFSGQIDTGWTLFFLEPDTYSPLCGKIQMTD